MLVLRNSCIDLHKNHREDRLELKIDDNLAKSYFAAENRTRFKKIKILFVRAGAKVFGGIIFSMVAVKIFLRSKTFDGQPLQCFSQKSC